MVMLVNFSFFLVSVFFFFFTSSMSVMSFSSYIVEFSTGVPFLEMVTFSFMVDYISCLFFSFVSLISSVVFIYSKFYMEDKMKIKNMNNNKFFFLLFLFVLSMFFLVFSWSWPVVMMGWDGLGVVSFLLVIFYNNSSSVDSGLITFFTNRLGDCFFIISFMMMYYTGVFSLESLTISAPHVFVVFLILGCCTKSAQIPFSSWLPAAMAAPTPVSSLVHSSTLVTAGIYLLIRFNYLIQSQLNMLTIISLTTMVVAGLIASMESDFKKIVAMSTLSQLGFMSLSISLGFWSIAFLHMVFHAIFKSSLFLSTGTLMHYLSGNQDSRIFGSMGSSFFSKLIFLTSSLSLMGFPLSLGFYSKETILSMEMFTGSNMMMFMVVVGAMFTVAYSIRLIYMGFSTFNAFYTNMMANDSPFFYTPIMMLYLFSLYLGEFSFVNLSPVMFFSSMESMLWVIVIGGGFLTFKASKKNFLVSFSTQMMIFLFFLSNNTTSKWMENYMVMMDNSWSEKLGGKGIKTIFMSSTSLINKIFSNKLSMILLMWLIFILLTMVS